MRQVAITRLNNKKYYLCDFNEAQHMLVWTRNVHHAIVFTKDEEIDWLENQMRARSFEVELIPVLLEIA